MRTAFMLLALTLVIPACGKGDPAPTPAPAPAPAAVAPAAPAAAPGGMAKINNIQGKVLERLDASSYSYLRIAGPDGEVWAAVPQTTVEAGETVTVVQPMLMTKFESKTLNRTFDAIYFGNLAGQAGAKGAQGVAVDRGKMAAAAVMGDDQAGASDDAMAAHGTPTAAAADVQVDKAPGGLNIGEIWAQKADLAGKPVTLRGKVVKFNSNILGKNWIHLQDGSGDPTSATHDLTITTADTATVGDVVTVTGTLVLDQDFGAGYAYPVIVQDARVVE